MNKSLMLSIQPKHVVNILNGYKTLELRKTVPKDFKGWVYIYCTKSKPYLMSIFKEWELTKYKTDMSKSKNVFNGNDKVVARFWFDDYIAYKYYEDDNSYFAKRPQDFVYNADEVIKRLCLSRDEFKTYGKGKDLYAWHIKKLEIFDTPLSLSDFYKQLTYPNGEIITPNICEYSPFDYDDDLNTCLKSFELKKAPQSYQYVYKREE